MVIIIFLIIKFYERSQISALRKLFIRNTRYRVDRRSPIRHKDIGFSFFLGGPGRSRCRDLRPQGSFHSISRVHFLSWSPRPTRLSRASTSVVELIPRMGNLSCVYCNADKDTGRLFRIG